jgi:hypothetical protein
MKKHDRDPIDNKYRLRARAAGVVTALGLGFGAVEAGSAVAAGPQGQEISRSAEMSPQAYAAQVSSKMDTLLNKMAHAKGAHITVIPKDFASLGIKEAVQVSVRSKDNKGYDLLTGMLTPDGHAAELALRFDVPTKFITATTVEPYLKHKTYMNLEHRDSSASYSKNTLTVGFHAPDSPAGHYTLVGPYDSQYPGSYATNPKAVEGQVNQFFAGANDILSRD